MQNNTVPPTSWRNLWANVTLIIVSTGLTGCAGLAEKIATRLAEDSIQRQQLLTVFEGDLTLFRGCLKERGGSCEGSAQTALPQSVSAQSATSPTTASVTPVPPTLCASTTASIAKLPADHPAKKAAATLNHPVIANVTQLHNHLRGHDTTPSAGFSVTSDSTASGSSQSTVHMKVSLSGARDFMDQVHQVTAQGGWSALSSQATDNLAKARPGTDEHADLTHDQRRAAFIKGYVKAYFRNGRFIAIDFKIDATQAQTELATELNKHSAVACQIFNASLIPAPDDANSCQNLAEHLYATLRGSDTSVDSQIVKISETGFVSRDASFSAQLPTLEIDIDPLASHVISLTTTQDGQAVQKIDFTTIGTQLVRVVLEAVFDAHEGLPAVNNATGRSLGDHSLPLFDATVGNVDAADFTAMTRINNRVEASTGVIVNRLIQGIGPFSLNNKSLEELFVTLVTTSVRKAMEKATWCWYACNLNVDVNNIRAEVRKEAEQIRLDLKIGS